MECVNVLFSRFRALNDSEVLGLQWNLDTPYNPSISASPLMSGGEDEMELCLCVGAAVPSPGPPWGRVRRREAAALRTGAAAQEGGGGPDQEEGIPNGGHHQGSTGEVWAAGIRICNFTPFISSQVFCKFISPILPRRHRDDSSISLFFIVCAFSMFV